MPIIVNLAFSLGIIWALLIIFNQDGNLKYLQQQAYLLLSCVSLAGLVAAWVIPPSFGLLVHVVQATALYFGVEKICDFPRAAAVRVTVWYFAIIFLAGLVFVLPLGL